MFHFTTGHLGATQFSEKKTSVVIFTHKTWQYKQNKYTNRLINCFLDFVKGSAILRSENIPTPTGNSLQPLAFLFRLFFV